MSMCHLRVIHDYLHYVFVYRHYALPKGYQITGGKHRMYYRPVPVSLQLI